MNQNTFLTIKGPHVCVAPIKSHQMVTPKAKPFLLIHQYFQFLGPFYLLLREIIEDHICPLNLHGINRQETLMNRGLRMLSDNIRVRSKCYDGTETV